VTFRSTWLLALLTSVGCGAPRNPDGTTRGVAQYHPLVFVHGDIWTMDPAHPHATTMIVDGGQITSVGGDELAAEAPKNAVVIDLHGKSVTPGLIDAHCHLYGLGASLERVPLKGLASEDAAAQVVGEAARSTPASEWVVGHGWDQNKWPGQAFPNHASLDKVGGSERPMLLRRIDGHAIWVSSKALALAGITAATPDPAGGKIMREANGAPTGVLVDNATELVESKMPPAAAATRERRIRLAARTAIAAGITGVHEMGIDDATAAVYRKLAASDQLPLRVYAFLAGDTAHPDALRTRAPDPATGRFAMRGVKFFADGALGSRGARLQMPYDDDPKNQGLWVTEPAALAAAVDGAVAGGWDVAVHAIGDAAIGSVLDAFAAAEQKHPGAKVHLRVEHTQVIAPADVERMASTHAIASMQPTHATSDMPWAEARVGKTRITGAYAWRTMLDHHVPLAFGSDFPVEDVGPLLGIYAAITRQDAAGNPPGGWYPAQRMTLEEAIAAFTRDAAAAEGDSTRGVIAPGKLADLTVYDGTLAPDRSLLALEIATTIVDGKVVFGAL
jgi:predicted amidohydrolase YtcJ